MSRFKNHLPTVLLVASSVGFMNARSPSQAAFFGMATVVMAAWMMRRSGKIHRTAGDTVAVLGSMRAEAPSRMRPVQVLAVVAFAVLALVMLASPEGWNSPARFGMAIMCGAIAGAQLAPIPQTGHWGPLIFSGGFAVAGGLFVWEAWIVVHSATEHAALTATKWSLFSAMLLLSGLSGLAAALGGRGRTPVYESGIVGPHGFVPWPDAESIDLVETPDLRQELCVGAYRGWTLRVTVPPEQSEPVRQLVTRLNEAGRDERLHQQDSQTAAENVESATAGAPDSDAS